MPGFALFDGRIAATRQGAIADITALVRRMVRTGGTEPERPESSPVDRPFELDAASRGSLDQIRFRAAVRREPGFGEVEVRVHSVALSFKDVLKLLGVLSDDELYVAAKDLQAPYDLVVEVARAGKLPVVLFTAGGIATPADAAMMMQLGAEGVFVGSGIFKSGNPAERAEAIVKATTFFDDPDVVAKVSRGLGEAMVGINVDDIPQPHRLAERGW